MKYIKKFEQIIIYEDSDEAYLSADDKKYLHDLPLQRGDYVRVIDMDGKYVPFNGRNEHPIFRIMGIDFRGRIKHQPYSIFSGDNFIGWFGSNMLVKVPDLEVDAEKYNL